LSGLGVLGWVAIRAELLTADGLAGHRAFTNPIWVNFDAAVDVVIADPNTPASQLRDLGNAPNPFNPQTVIRFSIAQEASVSIDVFAFDGQLVCRLVDRQKVGAGDHDVAWDGRDGAGRDLPSGVYLYKIRSGNEQFSGKMSLVR